LEFSGAIFERAAFIGAIAQFGGTSVTRTVVCVNVFEEARFVFGCSEDSDVDGSCVDVLGATAVFVFEALEEAAGFAVGVLRGG